MDSPIMQLMLMCFEAVGNAAWTGTAKSLMLKAAEYMCEDDAGYTKNQISKHWPVGKDSATELGLPVVTEGSDGRLYRG